MGKVNKLVMVAALGLALSMASSAKAGYADGVAGDASGGVSSTYDVELLSGGSSSVMALPGDTVPVDVVLTPQNSNALIGSLGADINISNGGLRYDDYLWNVDVFNTGDPNDATTRPENPPVVVDTIHIENLSAEGGAANLFNAGTLISLDLTVPGDATAGSSFEVTYKHLSLTEDGLFFNHDANVLGPLTVSVVPEPATLALLGIGGIAALRRRKKA